MKNNQIMTVGIILLIIVLPIIYLLLPDNRNISSEKENTHTMTDGTEMGNDMMHSHTMDMEEPLDDKGFINSMIPHHQEAVVTSQIILDKSNNPELVELAQNILTTQNQEIEDMKLWYQEWYQEEFLTGGEYMSMMRSLDSFENIEEMEQIYIEDMIIHHQGAISMANNILESTERQELKDFANSILEVQNKEVDILESLKN